MLLDERAALDHDVEGLVSHELAHQWWGDLLTCREWSEAWLNEGFATYFEYVWREHAKGRDEADLELLVDADGYLTEAGRYQRPVVCRQYDEPIHLFDATSTRRAGACCTCCGTSWATRPFWRAIAPLRRASTPRGSVETRDLARAIEEATGRNVDELLDRWIARAGHPELEGRWEWDEDRKLGTLRIAQKQPITPRRRCSSSRRAVRFEVDGREQRRARDRRREATHAFEFRLPARPTQVIFDPGDVVLKSIRLEKNAGAVAAAARGGAAGIDRVAAARALGRAARSRPASPRSATALRGDDFWGVRAAAARALGQTRRDDARDALVAALDDPHPRVRRAVAAGARRVRGRRDARRARWPTRLRRGDPSYFVEAEAALALGRTRSPRALALLPRCSTARRSRT